VKWAEAGLAVASRSAPAAIPLAAKPIKEFLTRWFRTPSLLPATGGLNSHKSPRARRKFPAFRDSAPIFVTRSRLRD
jgi:hypothetical protein